jgi:hypothetical protein
MGGIKDTIEAAKGVLEAVPVYQDTLQPAAKEIGKGLQTAAKTIHIALAPISILVWGYDTIAGYLQARLEEKLKDVPPKRIKEPNSSVAGPAVEALRFAMSDPDLREMYASLLATSMDRETAHKAHPAFVEIIRQMTADEAKILSVLAAEETANISQISLTRVIDPGVSDQIKPLRFSKYMYFVKKAQCEFSDLIPSYLVNLNRLGLTQHKVSGWHSLWLRPDGTYDYYTNQGMSLPAPTPDKSMDALVRLLLADELLPYKGMNTEYGVYSEVVELTPFGRQFSDACVVPPKSQ